MVLRDETGPQDRIKNSVFSLISMLEPTGSMLVEGQRPERGQMPNKLLTVVTRNVIVIKTAVP